MHDDKPKRVPRDGILAQQAVECVANGKPVTSHFTGKYEFKSRELMLRNGMRVKVGRA